MCVSFVQRHVICSCTFHLSSVCHLSTACIRHLLLCMSFVIVHVICSSISKFRAHGICVKHVRVICAKTCYLCLHMSFVHAHIIWVLHAYDIWAWACICARHTICSCACHLSPACLCHLRMCMSFVWAQAICSCAMRISFADNKIKWGCINKCFFCNSSCKEFTRICQFCRVVIHLSMSCF